jgi:hypothetical protein
LGSPSGVSLRCIRRPDPGKEVLSSGLALGFEHAEEHQSNEGVKKSQQQWNHEKILQNDNCSAGDPIGLVTLGHIREEKHEDVDREATVGQAKHPDYAVLASPRPQLPLPLRAHFKGEFLQRAGVQSCQKGHRESRDDHRRGGDRKNTSNFFPEALFLLARRLVPLASCAAHGGEENGHHHERTQNPAKEKKSAHA